MRRSGAMIAALTAAGDVLRVAKATKSEEPRSDVKRLAPKSLKMFSFKRCLRPITFA
jgi:hypothetical protein